MVKTFSNLKLVAFLAGMLIWGQWAIATHHHDLANSDTEICDICLVAQHGKAGLANAGLSIHVPISVESPTTQFQHSLISRQLPRLSSRAPPPLPV